jgi:hypothetical protein
MGRTTAANAALTGCAGEEVVTEQSRVPLTRSVIQRFHAWHSVQPKDRSRASDHPRRREIFNNSTKSACRSIAA